MTFRRKLAVAIATCGLGLVQPSSAADGSSTIKQLRASDLSGKALTPMPSDFTSRNIDRLSKEPAGFVEVPAYYSSDKRLEAAVKHYQRMTLRLKDWPSDEFMQILEGEVEISDAAGKATRYRAGDSILIPKGFNGTWKQLSDIKMVTVIYTQGQ